MDFKEADLLITEYMSEQSKARSMRWYAVPYYAPSQQSVPPEKRPAQVLNADGELIADCEALEDAEHIVDLHNDRLAETRLPRYRAAV